MYVPLIRTIILVLRGPGSLVIVFSVLLCLTGTSRALDVVQTRELSVPSIQYEKVEIKDAYNSSSSFDKRGMEGLYLITNIFLDGIQPGSKKFVNLSVENLVDDPLNYLQNNYPKFLLYHIGIVIILGIGILLALLIPFIGFIYCCCRCAGKCGGKPDPMEKKSDRYRRISLTATLSFLTLLMTFGLICAFVTNEYNDQSLRQFPSNAKSHLNDVELYINNTFLEARQLFVVNFEQLHSHINTSLKGSGENIKNELGRLSGMVHIEDLQNIVKRLDDILKYLTSIKKSTEQLRNKSAELAIKLEDFRKEFNKLYLDYCAPMPELTDCLNLKHEADIINSTNDFKKLPDLDLQTTNIQEVIKSEVNSTIQQASKRYEDIGKDIQAEVNKQLNGVDEQIVKVGQNLQDQETKLSAYLKKLDIKYARQELGHIKPFMDQISSYRWYAGITISCVVFLIILAYIIGILFGICGKRPGNVYGNDTCNKGVGATFLLIANGLIIFFYFYLMLATTVLFFTGALSYVYVCYPLEHPVDSQPLQIVDQIFKKYDIGIFTDKRLPFYTEEVLKHCHENKSIYKVLHLENVYNVTEYTDFDKLDKQYKITQKLDEAFAQLNKINLNQTFLSEEAENKLNSLQNSGLSSINFTQFTKELNSNVTLVQLDLFSKKIHEFSKKLAEVAQENFTALAEKLQSIYNLFVLSINEENKSLKNSLKLLADTIKIGESSLDIAVENFKKQILAGQKALKANGTAVLINLSRELADYLINDLKHYTSYCSNEIINNIGQCGPISQVINATVMDVCKAILSPFNGFWVSIGYILIFFMPSLCVAYSLVGLYRKTDAYPGILVETDSYHSGSFADRDTIPLAHVDKRKHPEQQGIINPNTMYDYTSESNTWADDYGDHEGQKRLSKCLLSQPPPSHMRNDFRDWGYRNGHGSNMNCHPVGSRGYEVYPMDATRPPAYLYPGPDYN